jgi:hypothetical protein
VRDPAATTTIRYTPVMNTARTAYTTALLITTSMSYRRYFRTPKATEIGTARNDAIARYSGQTAPWVGSVPVARMMPRRMP